MEGCTAEALLIIFMCHAGLAQRLFSVLSI